MGRRLIKVVVALLLLSAGAASYAQTFSTMGGAAPSPPTPSPPAGASQPLPLGIP